MLTLHNVGDKWTNDYCTQVELSWEDQITVLGGKLSHCHIIILFLKGKYSLHILKVQNYCKYVDSKLLWNASIYMWGYET